MIPQLTRGVLVLPDPTEAGEVILVEFPHYFANTEDLKEDQDQNLATDHHAERAKDIRNELNTQLL